MKPFDARKRPDQQRNRELALLSLGLKELHPFICLTRKDDLVKQIRIGVDRIARGEKPTMLDGGLFAIKTILPPTIPQETWKQVPSGTQGIAAEIAGTNWVIHKGTKNADNTLAMEQQEPVTYPEKQREVTFAQFIDRVAKPITDAYKEQHDEETTEPLTLGVSLGFPHENVREEGSVDIDARFITEEDPHVHGKLTKEWKITDWDDLSDEDKLIGKALRQKLTENGIPVGKIVIGNDTSMVALDAGARATAEQKNQDLIFFANGAVFGSGTNMTFDGINTEIGRAYWDYSDAHPIYEKMVENGWTKIARSELEHETGQFLKYRLAAGIQLLEKAGYLPHDKAQTYLEMTLNNETREDQSFMTKLATGEIPDTDQELQALAQGILRRAGQIYGIMASAVAETALGKRTKDDSPAVILAEGGVIHKGRISDTETIKDIAEETAKNLGQPIKIVKASGANGALTAAMSLPYLAQAA